MTKLLTQAFEKANQLSDEFQDELARQLLAELEGEYRWDQILAGSQEKLDRVAEKAEQEYLAGKTKELGFDDL